MADRVYQTEAVIIQRSSVGEHDRLLLLATPFGKKRAVARGVRKATSKLAGHIELFTHLSVQLAVGRSRDTLTQSVVVQAFARLHADLLRISCAYYCCELYDRLTPESDDTSGPFALLVTTLAALDGAEQPELVLRSFELQLLALLGYRQALQYCARCERELTEADNWYSPRDGGVVCGAHRRNTAEGTVMLPATFRFLRFAQRESPRRVAELRLSAAVVAQARALLADVLRPMIDRDLQSVRLLREVLDGTLP